MSFMDKMRDLVGIDYEEDDMDITQEEIDKYKQSMGAQASTAQPEDKSGSIPPVGFSGVEPLMTAMPKAADIKDSMNITREELMAAWVREMLRPAKKRLPMFFE